MVDRIKLDEGEYDIDKLSKAAQDTVESLKFVDQRINELTNMKALLQRAKNSYGESLKREMLSKKAGFVISND